VKVRFSKLADAEFEEAILWYQERAAEFAAAFFDEVNAMVNRIGESPELYAIAFAKMRRAMLQRFPYFLLYEVFPAEVVVFGVVHGARDPESWMSRDDT
jgi:plasmid stabilization system protein ParE